MPPDIPAWISAGVAAAAFGSTVWVTVSTTISSRLDRQREAIGIAWAVHPEVARLVADLWFLRARLQNERQRHNDLDQILSGYDVLDVLKMARVRLPPMIDRNLNNLHKLGEPAGNRCIFGISLLLAYQSFLEDQRRVFKSNPVKTTIISSLDIEQLFRRIDSDLHSIVCELTAASSGMKRLSPPHDGAGPPEGLPLDLQR